ncbi:tyrosine recombinase XerC [Janthinobacterium sp. 17J80-10]|uniref:tyrosine recombinase XerC n=1 Tax=Janthinobacterium sp. 17J80-10 TaxID=2497863 RepID=UPI0010054F46|nr:tyrosine recombinase XerC [Janthinobacterium sp. 17J80-10]QAU33289.1 tyrosine recombinase XerC [Janthinobacterium sp. 17J80-10]
MSKAGNQDWLESYLDSLETQRKLAAHTIVNYRRDLAELSALASRADGLGEAFSLDALNHFHIRKFAAQLHAQGQSGASIARKLSSWRGFYTWLAKQTALPANPVEGVKAPRRGKPLPKALSADDAVRLVAQANPRKDANAAGELCNRAMFELLYSSGLRISELVQLDLRYAREHGHESSGWIDFDAAEVRVTGKGGKMRQVPVGSAALQALTAWIGVRPALVKLDPHPLFLTERGSRMSARLVQMRIKAHARALDIPADVHPHMLRHSFASHVLQSSGDLRAVQEMLGHASIAATQIYTALDFQRLAKVYDAAHPRAKKK